MVLECQVGPVAVVQFQSGSPGRLWKFKQKGLCDGRKSLEGSTQKAKAWIKRVWDLDKSPILMKLPSANQETEPQPEDTVI